MIVMNNVKIQLPDGLTIDPTVLVETVKLAIAAELWKWIDANPNYKIFSVKWWILSKTVTVKDCRPIFTLLLGTDPNPNTPVGT